VLLELVLPRRCGICRAPRTDLCEACLAGLARIEPPLCARCGAPTAWPVTRCTECSGRRLAFATARAAVEHEPAFVRAWKERGLRRLAAVAGGLVAEQVPRPEGVLVPVPPDPERLLRRGADTAGALARELGRRWELPVATPLARAHGRRQRGLSRAERRRNVADAFSALASPRLAVLVDDVYTSGATVHAAASELRRAGAREVRVVTFARAIRRT
jgi:predicted amidophosphoribosyltransferase